MNDVLSVISKQSTVETQYGKANSFLFDPELIPGPRDPSILPSRPFHPKLRFRSPRHPRP